MVGILRAGAAIARRAALRSISSALATSPCTGSPSPPAAVPLVRYFSTPPPGLTKTELYIFNKLEEVSGQRGMEAQALREQLNRVQQDVTNTSKLMEKQSSMAKDQVSVTAGVTAACLGAAIATLLMIIYKLLTTVEEKSKAEGAEGMVGRQIAAEARAAAATATAAAERATAAAERVALSEKAKSIGQA